MAEYGENDGLSPNMRPKTATTTAVAVQDRSAEGLLPDIVAAGRGKLAEEILQLALSAGIKVREDADLADLLARFEIDSPVPTEALMAVGEILSYVYKANGQPNPFDAVLKETLDKHAKP